MFVKLTTLACALAVVAGAWNGPLAGGQPAASVPAGISAQACPNYPHCTNPSVAVEPNAPAPHAQQYNAPHYNQAPSHYNHGSQYNSAPQYNPVPQYNQAPQYNQYAHAPQYQGAASNNAMLTGEYTGDGDYRGEGLAESGAFGPVDDPKSYDATPAPQAYHQQAYQAPSFNHAAYQPQPQAYNNAPVYNQAHNVPAGVDPSFCPNYPFCS